MKLKKFFLFGMWLTILLLFAGCGYRLVGSSSLPSHIKTIAIPTFDNDTNEPGIEDVLTQALRTVFLRGGKVKLVGKDSADALLSGKILWYNDDEVIEFNEQNNPSKYRLTITLDITLEDRTTGKVLWQDQQLQGTSDFSGGDDSGLSTESKQQKLEELASELAEKVRALSTKGF
jgi:outer membrane lipopolysaccharide assembly protein LptE/RlpB